MLATKIKMKPGCYYSSNLLEIDQIYITGCENEGYYYKAAVHDAVKKNAGMYSSKYLSLPGFDS